jgi:hypothetical protein
MEQNTHTKKIKKQMNKYILNKQLNKQLNNYSLNKIQYQICDMVLELKDMLTWTGPKYQYDDMTCNYDSEHNVEDENDCYDSLVLDALNNLVNGQQMLKEIKTIEYLNQLLDYYKLINSQQFICFPFKIKNQYMENLKI